MMDINDDIRIVGLNIINTNEVAKRQHIIVKYRLKDNCDRLYTEEFVRNVSQDSLLQFVQKTQKKGSEYDNFEDYYDINDMYEEYGNYNYLDEEDEYERVKVRGFEL